jgi:uncharacterized membrane protein YjjB (DUF3815 family)
MSVPHSFKLVVATWVAALFGALAGHALAQASKSTPRGAHVTVAAKRLDHD